MSHTLASKFFNLAKEEGIISQGFVWITAHGSTDILDVVNSRALGAMHGVLQVKPHVQDTVELQNFRQRWRNKYRSKKPGTRLSEPTLSGLYAYDTVWALALAAEKAGCGCSKSECVRSVSNSGSTDFEKIGASKTAKKLRGTLLDVNFTGLSGEFKIQDLQLPSVNYEIINIVGRERRLLGFWTPGSGISRSLNRTADLPTIIWPGDNGAAPRGWLFPMNKNLTIGVPMKGGFDKFVTYENGPRPKGFCIKVFEAVVAALPYTVNYSYHVFKDGKGKSNGTYDELVQKVYLKEYDAVVGDITILANRSSYVDFTLPYTDSGVRMLVPVRDRRQKTAWTFLKPLTAGLWLGTGAFVVFTGFVVWCIEHRVNEGFRGPPVNQIGSVFYFSFSTLVFAHREKIVNNLSRVIVVVWLFVVLILQQSYTASLSSILTVEQLQPTVTNLEDVIRQGSYVGYLNDSFMPGLLKSLKIDESKTIAYNSPTEYNEALTTGRVAVIIDEIPYLKVFLEQYCRNYTMIGPTYKFDGFGFAFPRGSPLTSEISREILRFASTTKMSELEKALYGDNPCPDKDDSQTSSSLTLHSFQGLFIITGASSMLALILHIVITFYNDWHGLNSDSSQNSWNRCLDILSKLFQERNCPSNNPDKEPTTKSVGTTTIEIPPNLDMDAVCPPEEGTPAEELSVQDAEPPSFAHSVSSQSSWNKCRNILSKLLQERNNPSNNPDKEPTTKNVGTATIEIPLNVLLREGTPAEEHSVQDAEPPSVAHSERGLNVAAFLSRNGSSIRRRQVNA
ncbi:hypothetical protein BRADI_4g30880v3 [Brachypodium distachyon]|nr:hypothetical protein BRADI_4g30880v3 [Brachypodium distachyon]